MNKTKGDQLVSFFKIIKKKDTSKDKYIFRGVFMKKKILIVLGVIVLISIGIVINLINKKPTSVTIKPSEADYSSTTKIICQIKGEVARPGVYSLDKGSRLQDLVLAAGGFTSMADTNSVSLVSVIEDSGCYIINKLDNTNSEANANLLNINLATKEELTSLPGIGEAKAQAIIDYRNQNGNFNSVNDLTKVNGISEKILNQIIDLICVR